jgi:uncharacterized protein (TIGR00730 family)
MKKITVFCGASIGSDKLYETYAKQLGQTLAKHNIDLIYGGATIGLMGAVADGALLENGNVIGVIPKFLEQKEIAHKELTELIIVDSMHQRKTKMNDLCDGAISLPGGFGTFEELFEMLTWAQLGLHSKPLGILNIDGYYDPLILMIQTMVDKGFLKETHQQMLLVSDNIDDLLHKMKNYSAPSTIKWINKETV